MIQAKLADAFSNWVEFDYLRKSKWELMRRILRRRKREKTRQNSMYKFLYILGFWVQIGRFSLFENRVSLSGSFLGFWIGLPLWKLKVRSIFACLPRSKIVFRLCRCFSGRFSPNFSKLSISILKEEVDLQIDHIEWKSTILTTDCGEIWNV